MQRCLAEWTMDWCRYRRCCICPNQDLGYRSRESRAPVAARGSSQDKGYVWVISNKFCGLFACTWLFAWRQSRRWPATLISPPLRCIADEGHLDRFSWTSWERLKTNLCRSIRYVLSRQCDFVMIAIATTFALWRTQDSVVCCGVRK